MTPADVEDEAREAVSPELSPEIQDRIHAGHQKYRPDIDGLRAISILLVLGFHSFPGSPTAFPLFGGGFIGVDIFFTISGFLISSIIFSEIDDRRFSFSRFYARRVRRIFPALAVVLLACYGLGAALLLTTEFQDLCKYIAASAGFVANIVLLNNIGYFDSSADFKPLLHMWSLGIEEQFYFFWPVAAYFAWKGRLRIAYLLTAVFVLSFVANLWIFRQDVASAYYLPYTRFFELIAGAGIAYLTIFRIKAQSLLAHTVQNWFDRIDFCNALSVSGAAAIAIADLRLTAASPYPGWWALLPTMGGVLIIAAGPQAWINRRLLANPAMVFIGMISYPLYLWHWPLLSFLYITYPNPHPWQKVAAVIAAVLLSWITYRLVERPIRFSKSRMTVPLLCAVIAVLGLTGLVISRSEKFHLRGSASDLAQLQWEPSNPACYRMLHVEREAAKDAVFCYMSNGANPRSVAILGDSMANSLYPGLRDLYASRGVGVINLGVGTCAPFRDLYGSFSWNKDCKEVNDKIYAFVAGNPEIKTVILGFSSWDIQHMNFDAQSTPMTQVQKFARMKLEVARDIGYLVTHGKTIVVTYDGPNLKVDPRTCLMNSKKCDVAADAVEGDALPYLKFWFDVFNKSHSVCVFSQREVLRKGSIYPMYHAEGLAFRDDHHLSYIGSAVVAKAFRGSRCFPLTLIKEK